MKNQNINYASAVDLIEGFTEPESDEEIIAAWQFLVDTGLVWQLQGRFGRTAAGLIESGIINPPSHGNDLCHG